MQFHNQVWKQGFRSVFHDSVLIPDLFGLTSPRTKQPLVSSTRAWTSAPTRISLEPRLLSPEILMVYWKPFVVPVMDITHLPSAKPYLYKQTNNDDTILTGTLLQGQTHPCQLCSGLVHKGSWSAGQYRRLGSLAHKIERQQMKQNWLGHHRLCWPGSSFHGKIPTFKPKQDTNLQYVAYSKLRM